MENESGMKNDANRDVEVLVSQAIDEFLKKNLGEQYGMVSTRILEDAITVKFKESLPPAEKHMLRRKDGMQIIKELKIKLMERATPLLKQMIKTLTKTEVVDVHSSVNPETGEYIEVFTLNKENVEI